MEHYPSSELETIGAEHYFDFQMIHPVLHHSPGRLWIQWPHITLQRVRLPERGPITVVGPEPNQSWCSFSRGLVQQLKRYESPMVLLLGAILSDTPHSCPLSVAIYIYDSQLEDSLAIEKLTYESPTGITGVVNQMLIVERFSSAPVWVSIPHYVATPPNPKGQHVLLNRMERVPGVSLRTDDLLSKTDKRVQTVNKPSTEDSDVTERIEQPEEARDTSDVEGAIGGSIAMEFERHLRNQGDGPG